MLRQAVRSGSGTHAVRRHAVEDLLHRLGVGLGRLVEQPIDVVRERVGDALILGRVPVILLRRPDHAHRVVDRARARLRLDQAEMLTPEEAAERGCELGGEVLRRSALGKIGRRTF